MSRVWAIGGRTPVRIGAVALLAASGIMTIAASRERWSPACGNWHASACLKVQDHRYDYLPPSAPWSPIGDAAHYAAVAELLLAAAVLMLPSLLFPGRPVLTRAIGALTTLCILVIALGTWASAQAGQAVTTPALLPALAFLALAWPLGLITLALLSRATPDRPGRRWRTLVLFSLLMASPVPQRFLAVGPYDTAPWMDASAGCLILLAGCALWPAIAPDREAPHLRDVGPVPGPMATSS